MDDEDDLKSPSNAIKIKYDLTTMIKIKRNRLIKSTDKGDDTKKGIEACNNVDILNKSEWGERVTKLARTILILRTFSQNKAIPSPEDVRKLNIHLITRLKDFQYKEDVYSSLCTIAQARLLLYNKRRSGEIDAMSLKDFNTNRKTELNDVDKSLIGDLSDLEMHLLSSQDLIITRGKVILDLKENQLTWLCNHLGHTKKVHLEHYRQMSGFIERVEISKILLIQDMNLTEKFKGKTLKAVSMKDIINSNQGQGEQEEEEEDDAQKAAQSTLEALEDPCPQDIDDYIPDEYYFDEENQDYAGEGSSTSVIVKKRKSAKKCNRMKWTETEEEEIRIYFKKHLAAKKTPRKEECLKVLSISKEKGGQLHRRYWHTVIKKVSNMNKKD
ncbi:uncharacterized protein LOC127732765 [Mytilus californianus]|uniref:uncharacterized protein LOC127732765 n=1 Tax=Mytilus californianus TaxID=6549 RepID=UPI0022460C22|nr:uncharacterized protein LOC127732765 [Mytilus californianus]